MKGISYAYAVGSLIYIQVCTKIDSTFTVGMLGRYHSNICIYQWRVANKVMRYLQGTKGYMFIYRQTDNPEIVGYLDSNFTGCSDSRKSTSRYVFLFAS